MVDQLTERSPYELEELTTESNDRRRKRAGENAWNEPDDEVCDDTDGNEDVYEMLRRRERGAR